MSTAKELIEEVASGETARRVVEQKPGLKVKTAGKFKSAAYEKLSKAISSLASWIEEARSDVKKSKMEKIDKRDVDFRLKRMLQMSERELRPEWKYSYDITKHYK